MRDKPITRTDGKENELKDKELQARGLPTMCVAELPSTGETIIIKRGEPGYNKSSAYHTVDAINERMGVVPAQREAMLGGSMFGWECPGAFPSAYDEQGHPIIN